MMNILTCLLALLFFLSGLAMEGNGAFWLSSLAAKEGQQIFRVVNDAELKAIQQSGKFEFPPWGSTPTGQPGKFFWGNADEATKFQQMWYRGGESSHIVTTTIGPEVNPILFPHGDGIGTSLFIDLKDLTAPIKVLPKP